MVVEAQQALRLRPESSKLRRELSRLDTVCLLIAAIVVIDTLGAVANGGAQALTWLLVVSLTFFVPAGLVISELGAAFPQEGGAYVWTRLAFGRACGALTAFLYWIESPIWLGGSLTITSLTVFGEFFTPIEGIWRYVFALGFIWTAIAMAIAPISKGKRVAATGAAVQVVLLTFFTVTVGLYALEHGVHGFGLGHLSPTWAAFIAVAPVLFYNLIGFELPSAAAGEMRDPQRDVPASIARAGALTLVLYTVPIVAILAVVPCGSDHEPDGLHRRDEERLHRVRRPRVPGRHGRALRRRPSSRGRRGRRLHLGSARERAHLGSRHRPGSGGRLPRRRGPAQPGALLRPARHSGAHVPRLGWGGDGDDGCGLRCFR